MKSEYHVEYYDGTTNKRMEWWGYKKNISNIECQIFHREEDKAYIGYYFNGDILSIAYLVNNIRHRLDGPFWISYRPDGKVVEESYALFGEILTKEQFYDEDYKQSFIMEHS